MLRNLVAATVSAVLLSACITIELGDGSDGEPTPDPTSTPTAESDRGMVRGSGVVASEEREVSGFDSVAVEGVGELYVEPTGTESLTIEAEDNILPLLRSRVLDGELVLDLEPGTGISTTEPIIYRLTVAGLNSISASGSPEVDARGIVGDELTVSSSGTSKVRMTGNVTDLRLHASGTSSFSGRQLQSQNAAVEVSGSAEVLVNATDALSVEVSGTADVRYVGSPRVSEQVSGLGSVERAD